MCLCLVWCKDFYARFADTFNHKRISFRTISTFVSPITVLFGVTNLDGVWTPSPFVEIACLVLVGRLVYSIHTEPRYDGKVGVLVESGTTLKPSYWIVR